MRKSLVLFFSSLFLIQPVLSQGTLQLMNLSDKDIPKLPSSEFFSEKVVEDNLSFLNHRYNIMGYKPIKFDGYQVISSHQANSNFDIVYFIDNKGETVRKVFATTAPMNFDHIATSHFDSMNPYGSVGMASALINGLLGTIFNRGLGLR